LRWSKPRRIFVNLMGDLFHPDVPDDFIDRVFAVMALSPQHTFQVLTKRPERMRAYMNHGEGFGRWGFIDGRARQIYVERNHSPFPAGKVLIGPLPNVWLGVSVEDQTAADERIPLLLKTPAAVRWISAEPLLGSVDLSRWIHDIPPAGDSRTGHDGGKFSRLDWVVVGGESGPSARPMHPDWARSLRDQCAAAGVPFLFKQWGEWRPICEGGGDWYNHLYRSRRIARDGESQETLDDLWGRTCTVPDGVIRIDGSLLGHTAPGAYQQGTHSMQTFRIGKKRAGRLLDGAQHDGYP
jgi:protein gp37